MARLLLLNGPNLNLLGTREPALYGTQTLAGITDELRAAAAEMGHELLAFQSNHEGALIDRVHAAALDGTAMAIVNPGALTHTSVALRDAFLGAGLGFVEVHLSNLHAREDYRQRSYFSDIAQGVIVGFGATGYSLALLAACDLLLLAGTNAGPGSAPSPTPAAGQPRSQASTAASDESVGWDDEARPDTQARTQDIGAQHSGVDAGSPDDDMDGPAA